ncbi:MAG: hypothetical protein EOM20_02100 [Spartobacteria bacterium]|nr:hypothetical protein [Spartobacteria bacterium]
MPPADELQMLVTRWHEILDRVGQTAHLARSYLLDTKPIAVDADQVRIGFDPEFANEKDKIDYPHNKKALQKAISDLLGRQVNVVFSVLDAKSTLPGDVKMVQEVKNPAADDKIIPVLTGKSSFSAQVKKTWQKNPAVRRALEIFNGDIIDVRE